MHNDKLTMIAGRQLDYSFRDIAFGALMAVVVAVMLLAFTTTGKLASASPAEHAPVYSLSDTAAEIHAHTAAACGDLEASMPAADPAC